MLVIAWHLLSDPDARFADLGSDWHDRPAPIGRKRQLITELERLSARRSCSPHVARLSKRYSGASNRAQLGMDGPHRGRRRGPAMYWWRCTGRLAGVVGRTGPRFGWPPL
jgi:hypothetical protein